MQNHKKIDEKKFFIEFFYPNLTFFRGLWRSLRPSWCFLRVYYWLKYDYGSFSQSSRDAKHVRIGLKNKKNFVEKKNSSKFLTQIWHFPRSQYEKSSLLANFECQKKFFWDLKSKIRFHSFVGLDLEHRLSTHNMVISLELKATKNQKWKNPKNQPWVHFCNNRLQMSFKLLQTPQISNDSNTSPRDTPLMTHK